MMGIYTKDVEERLRDQAEHLIEEGLTEGHDIAAALAEIDNLRVRVAFLRGCMKGVVMGGIPTEWQGSWAGRR